VNLIVYRAEMKAKLSFSYDHLFEFPKRNTGFIFKVNQCKWKYVFPCSYFEGNSSIYVFDKSF